MSRPPENLTPEERKALLARLLRERGGRKNVLDEAAAIPRLPEDVAAPASYAQERMWALKRLHLDQDTYNVPFHLRLQGPLDRGHLEESLTALTARHEALRTTFQVEGEQLLQVVHPPRPFALEELDWSQLTAAEVKQRAAEHASAPFHLEQGPLYRASLARLGPDEHLLLQDMHHSITDGTSLGILVRDMAELYGSRVERRPAVLPELPLRFRDYAHWQREQFQTPAFQSRLAYWLRQLGGAPTLEFPADRSRPRQSSGRGAIVCRSVGEATVQRMEELARAEGVTPFVVALAAYLVVLHRYTGQTDLVVGSPHASRERLELQNIVGCFINSLVLRTDVSGNPTFSQLLARVKNTAFPAYANNAPFGKIVEALKPERSLHQNPIFQTMFVMQGKTMNPPRFGDVVATVVPADTGTAKFDFSATFAPIDGRLDGLFEYSTEVFERETVERMAEAYVRVLDALVREPATAIGAAPILAEAERVRAVHEWNQTVRPLPEERTLPALFEAQVARTPHAPALEQAQARLSYAELDAFANRIAHRLQKEGVGPEVLVGVHLERSPELIAALLGILKAGGAYLPLDPRDPPERLRHILDDAGAKLLVTSSALGARLDAKLPQLRLDDERASLEALPSAPPPPRAGPDNLAYVIYTSGSTGKPKGVAIEHRSIVNFAVQAADLFQTSTADRVLQFASLGFDAAAEEIFPCLLRGACLVLRTERMLDSTSGFLDHCDRLALTVLDLPTALWHALGAELEAGAARMPERVRLVVIGGERALPEKVAAWRARFPERPRLLNTYGPTETTVAATAQDLTHPSPAALAALEVPIGRPLGNVRTYVLDASLQPVPLGAVGELFIGGAAVARGYLGRPDLTADRFLPDPFSPGARMYRSGDKARFLPDGTLEYRGRGDDQVKIRGYRIELGEVENALAQLPGVAAAAAAAHASSSGDARLVGYLVMRPGSPFDEHAIRAALASHLPAHFIPAALLQLEGLPLTPSGKLDRKALPAPSAPDAAHLGYVAPRNPLEHTLASLFADLLGLERVGIHDSFFELGGDSIQAIRLASRALRDGLEFPPTALFEHPSVEALARVAQKVQSGPVERRAVARRPQGEALASFGQESLWLLSRLNPTSPAYHVSFLLQHSGQLDRAALRDALTELERRHEVLRTSLHEREGRVLQVIHQPAGPELIELDLRGMTDAEIRQLCVEAATRPFNLDQGPVWRAGMLQVGEREHLLLLCFHHIAFDGWSLQILRRELDALYAGEPLPPLALQYADYAHWQREQLQGERLERLAAYWRSRLADAPALDLPTDHPRPAVRSERGGQQRFQISAELRARLEALARDEGGTLFMALLAGFQLLLSRWSGQEDVVVGTPVAGRGRPELEGLIGFFVNTLPLRTDLSGEPSFRALLQRVKQTAVEAFQHQELPFEKVVEAVNPDRDTSRTPLFQAMLVLQPAPRGQSALGGLPEERWRPTTESAKFDLTASFFEAEEGLECALTYCADLFERATASRMAEHLVRLLDEGSRAPDAPAFQLPMLSEPEQRQQWLEWNCSAQPAPAECFIELFAASVERWPDSPAVVFEGVRLSYRELDRRSNALARKLHAAGVARDVPVGILLERSAEVIVAMLGIMKAGGAYLPLDSTAPGARSSMMLEEARAPILLSQRSLSGGLSLANCAAWNLEDGWASGSEASFTSDARPDDLAYVIFTSGSTGRPKGVAVEHRSLCNYVRAVSKRMGLPDRASYATISTFAADLGHTVIFPALASGGELHVISQERTTDPALLASYLAENRVDCLKIVPSHFAALMSFERPEAVLPRKLLVLGGELSRWPLLERIRELAPECRVLNHYGPTETTVGVLTFPASEARAPYPADAVPLGRPLDGIELYLLDAHRQPVPVGVAGELYIGGAGVARGYLHRPELTAERFVDNPARPGQKVYRSGDRARFLPDGNLVFLGRSDDQVKIRGYRVEPAEVAAVLRRDPRVADAAVVARPLGGEMRLVGYVVARGPARESAELLSALASAFPPALIPSALVFLDRLPLTPNGKLDRKALPVPQAEPAHERVAPRDPLERRLAAIFAEVLRLPEVGITESFFELGGHSLLAVRLVSMIRRDLGPLSLAAIFEAPTVAALAQKLASGSDAQARALVPLAEGGEPPLFLIHPVGGGVQCYRALAALAARAVYGLQSPALEESAPQYRSIPELAARYRAELTARQPTGPYLLGGWSLGGIVAYELATQLRARGEQVSRVVLLDTWAHRGGEEPDPRQEAIWFIRNLTGELIGQPTNAADLEPLPLRAQFELALERLRAAGLGAELELRHLLRLFTAYKHHLRAARAYVLQPGLPNLRLIRATGRPGRVGDPPDLGWREVAGPEFAVLEVPGNHYTMFTGENLDVLARKLREALEGC